MPIIKINNVDYDTDTLSAEAKAQLEMLALTDAKIRELQRDMAIAQTARNAYGKSLAAALPTPLQAMTAKGDTIQLG